MVNKTLEKMERSELIQLIEIYSKNWLAMDGVWFQSVERKFLYRRRWHLEHQMRRIPYLCNSE